MAELEAAKLAEKEQLYIIEKNNEEVANDYLTQTIFTNQMKNAGLFVILFFRRKDFEKSTCFLLAGLSNRIRILHIQPC